MFSNAVHTLGSQDQRPHMGAVYRDANSNVVVATYTDGNGQQKTSEIHHIPVANVHSAWEPHMDNKTKTKAKDKK